MIGLATIAKLAKGTIGPDEIGLLFEQMGMDVQMGEATRQEFSDAFRSAGKAAALPSSRLLAISGNDKQGCRIEALIVLAPPDDKKSAPKN